MIVRKYWLSSCGCKARMEVPASTTRIYIKNDLNIEEITVYKNGSYFLERVDMAFLMEQQYVESGKNIYRNYLEFRADKVDRHNRNLHTEIIFHLKEDKAFTIMMRHENE